MRRLKMARTARVKSISGIFHIMLRGIDKQDLFLSQSDYETFIRYLRRVQKKKNFNLFAYCLMPNHVHLLLMEKDNDPGSSLQCLEISYAQYFNRTYNRVGHVFQNRFKSEPINDDPYFITVTRYIHYNPVKAGLTKHIYQYYWSSIHEYKTPTGLVNTDFTIKLFGDIETFYEYHQIIPEEKCLDYENKQVISDEEAELLIHSVVSTQDFHTYSSDRQTEIIKRIKAKTGVSISQMERVLGISKYYIHKSLIE